MPTFNMRALEATRAESARRLRAMRACARRATRHVHALRGRREAPSPVNRHAQVFHVTGFTSTPPSLSRHGTTVVSTSPIITLISHRRHHHRHRSGEYAFHDAPPDYHFYMLMLFAIADDMIRATTPLLAASMPLLRQLPLCLMFMLRCHTPPLPHGITAARAIMLRHAFDMMLLLILFDAAAAVMPRRHIACHTRHTAPSYAEPCRISTGYARMMLRYDITRDCCYAY